MRASLGRRLHLAGLVTLLVCTGTLVASATPLALASGSHVRGAGSFSVSAPAVRPVSIPLAGGQVLAGTLYGTGRTGVVLSPMLDGSTQTSWRPLARRLARRGYAVLTYDFLGYGRSRIREGVPSSQDLARDLRSAIGFVKKIGARPLVLGGASGGGVATLKVATTLQPRAVLVLASPLDCCGVGLRAAELRRLRSAKLFVSAQHDATGVTPSLETMFKKVAPPKELHIYPKLTQHGTELFKTNRRDDLLRRIDAFLTRYAPPLR